MMQLFLFGSVICLTLKEAVFQLQTERTDCTTSNQKPGKCLPLDECRSLIEQLNVGMLKKNHCGLKEKSPKICCPNLVDDDSSLEHAVSPKGLNSNKNEMDWTTLPSAGRNAILSLADEQTTENETSHNSNGTKTGRNLNSLFPRDCGRSHNTFRRIVGGQESSMGAWPWMAVIYYRRRNSITAECGGVLVTNKHVLTAAHCIVSSRRGRTMRPSQLLIRLGDHDIERTDEGADHVDVSVEQILKIDSFDLRTFQNDIAILVLGSSVEFTETISPICIPFDVFKTEDLAQRNAFVAGWGTLSYGGPASSRLQEVQVRVWENIDCKHVFRREVPITSANLCAGDGDKDACRGDSGGPLMLTDEEGKFYLVGLVSFGKKCAEPGIPGVYTRITTFLDWIESNIESTL